VLPYRFPFVERIFLKVVPALPLAGRASGDLQAADHAVAWRVGSRGLLRHNTRAGERLDRPLTPSIESPSLAHYTITLRSRGPVTSDYADRATMMDGYDG
jgi:hypothetical protein